MSPEGAAEPEVAGEAEPIPRGRRRDSSRHRFSGSVRLPRWAAWFVRDGTSLLSLVPVLVAVVLVQALGPAAEQVPVDGARFATAGGWALAHRGALQSFGHWLDVPWAGWLQLGLVNRLLLGGSGQSVLAAAHGAMLLLTVVTVSLVWSCARRAGASGLAAGGGAAAFGVAPFAVTTHATVSAVNVAVAWLLLALLLALGDRRAVAAAGSGAAAAAAVLSAPTVLVAVPVLAWVWLRRPGKPSASPRRHRSDAPRRFPALVAVLAFLASLVAAGIAVRGLSGLPVTAAARTADAIAAAAERLTAFPAGGAATVVAWLTADPLSLLVGLVAVVLAAPSRRFRPAVLLVLLVGIGSFWPAGRDAVGPAALLLPLLALATSTAIDRAVVALGSPRFIASVLGAGWLMGVAALLVVATVVWSVSFGRTRVADAPVLSAEQWVRETARAHDVVLVDLAVWPDLSRSSGAAVGWYAAPSVGTSGVPSSASWSRADFVVATPLLQRHAGGAAAAVLRRSVPVAAFGSGDSAIEVRAVRRAAPAPSPSPPSAAELRAAEARKQTGAELARNPHLILTASGRAELRAGDVDSRVAIVLAQLLATQRVTVADFPAVKSDHGGPRRRVLISAVDGHPVPEDKARSADLIRYLSGLRGDFATATIEAGDAGVLATFAPDPTFVPPS